ncbi:MAG: S8 family serine peptidase [Candidatus Marinimicrobia bacterium]|nr:S8 family serine peptidase [Candidatus Neomarinimicrobiota bacterium]
MNRLFGNSLRRGFLSLAVICVIAIGVAGVGTSQVNAAVLGPGLTDSLATLTGDEELTVVLTFTGDRVTKNDLDIVRTLGIDQGITFEALPIMGVKATETQIQALAEKTEVLSIWPNKELEYYNYEGRHLTGVVRARTNNEIIGENGGFPIDGSGVAAMINDSGIDATHSDLEYGDHVVQNVQAVTNLNSVVGLAPVVYLEDQLNTDTNSGHGTHCAGTFGGTGARSNGKYAGVAPGADIVGYGSGGVLLILDAVGGFNYALTHPRLGIRVISNSWGTTGNFDPTNPINVASYWTTQHNINVLFAAGNEGPGENTLNPYSLAPWVISVGAGDKSGKLADFSSRGVQDGTGHFTYNGEQFTYHKRPTVSGPGVDIISTRASTNLSANGGEEDIGAIEEAFLPFYTRISGTSMSTPHVAGIVALMLEADPTLSTSEVKEILEKTATNMSGRQRWEAGTGYVNAFAAVSEAMGLRTDYGETVNSLRTFNSNAQVDVLRTGFTVDYNPITLISDNSYQFMVPSAPENPDRSDVSQLQVKIDVSGYDDLGNIINLVLIAPDGTEYSSGVSVLFTLYHERAIVVESPDPGTWTAELRGIRGDEANPTDGVALPENGVPGVVTLRKVVGFDGLSDINGHRAEDAIKVAVSERLADGLNNGDYKPDRALRRYHLAEYLTMGMNIRQYLPPNNSSTFSDVWGERASFAEAVAAKGAAIRDTFQVHRGVMLPEADGKFSPWRTVERYELAYSLVQSLGLESQALALNDEQVTVYYQGERIPVEDADEIPEDMRGYVQMALDLGIMNAHFSLTQGPYDLEPTVHATFEPQETVNRGEYAVASTRFYASFLEGFTLPEGGAQASMASNQTAREITTPERFSLEQNYPNPFNPSTTISYNLPEESRVTLSVYNALGQQVTTLQNSVQDDGHHTVQWNGTSADGSVVPSGVYFYRIRAGEYTETKKMMLMR